jgi:hypothetical protein
VNELGRLVCKVLDLQSDHVISVQINEAVNELPTATIVMQIWPNEMAQMFAQETPCNP